MSVKKLSINPDFFKMSRRKIEEEKCKNKDIF